MIDVGDYIIYGINGVCKVENVGAVDVDGIPKDKMYYTLIPVYSKGNKIFTPMDNSKVFMRPVISKGEAWRLIEDIKDLETLLVIDDRRSEEAYKETLKKCDCREMAKLVKTLYLIRQSRIALGKKTTAGVDKHLIMAKESLFGELAISLEMDKNKVEQLFIERVEHSGMA